MKYAEKKILNGLQEGRETATRPRGLRERSIETRQKEKVANKERCKLLKEKSRKDLENIKNNRVRLDQWKETEKQKLLDRQN